MFGWSRYSISLLESAILRLLFSTGREEKCEGLSDCLTQASRFQNLIYREDLDEHHRFHWAVKALSDKIVGLLHAMFRAPNLQLHEFIVDPSISCEDNKGEAWAQAFEKCPGEVLVAWTSKFAFVERLQLYIDDRAPVMPHYGGQRSLQKQFTDVLQVADNLEDLQISGTGWDVIAMLGERNVPYPRLRKLLIEVAHLEATSLVGFCRQHMLTLQILFIRSSHVREARSNNSCLNSTIVRPLLLTILCLRFGLYQQTKLSMCGCTERSTIRTPKHATVLMLSQANGSLNSAKSHSCLRNTKRQIRSRILSSSF